MKKLLLASVIAAVSVGVIASKAADKQQPSMNAAAEAVDTTDWGTRPEATGMTAEQFIRAEGLDFAANLVKKNGLNTFNTPTIASVDNQILTTPNVNVLYTAAIVDMCGCPRSCKDYFSV